MDLRTVISDILLIIALLAVLATCFLGPIASILFISAGTYALYRAYKNYEEGRKIIIVIIQALLGIVLLYMGLVSIKALILL